MAIINNYFTDYDLATTSTSTSTGTYWNTPYYDAYNKGYISKAYYTNYIGEAKPKKKTFGDELQDEINDWLDIFKEN